MIGRTGCAVRALAAGLQAVMAVCAVRGADAERPAGERSIGVFLNHATVDLEIVREWRAEGLHVDWQSGRQPPADLSAYHVVAFVVPDAGAGDWASALKGFLARGGGLLLAGDFAGPGAEAYARTRQAVETERLLRFFREDLGYGGPTGPAFADPKVDCELSQWWEGFGISLTRNVPATPVAAGVEQVWYPNGLWGRPEWGQAGGMRLSGEWKVALRSNRGSSGAAEDAPALLALREWGGGRVAVTPISFIYSLNTANHPTIRKRVYSEGINDLRSDFHRLLKNTVRWLAEPALADSSLGGFVLAEERTHPPKPRIVEPVDWTSVDGEEERRLWPPQTESFRGFIGCRTPFSGGADPVERYAAAARELGLSFLVFLEDFERMTPERLARLEEDCLAATGEDLAVFPGLLMRDDADHTGYYFGRGLAWPPESCLTEDGRAIASRNARTGSKRRNEGKPKALGLLEFLHDNTGLFKSGAETFPQTFGYCNFTPVRESAPIWDLRLYSSIALEYGESGTVIDRPEDILDDFLRVNNDGHRVQPFAVHRVRSAEEMREAIRGGAWLTHVAYSPHPRCPVVDGQRPLDLRIMYNLKYHYTGTCMTYVSNGPVLHGFMAGRHGPYSGNGYNPANSSGRFEPMPNVRDRLGIDVSSEAGIREVRLYANRCLARRYLPGGVRRFRKVLECLHDRSRSYVLEVTDEDGKKLISGPSDSGANYAWLLCSDRINGEICHGPFYFAKRSQIDVGSRIVHMPPFTDAHFPRRGLSLKTMPLIYFAADTPLVPGEVQPVALPNQQWQIDLVADNARRIGVNSFKDYLPDEVVANGWTTYGPLTEPRTLTMEQTLTEFWPVDALSVWYDGFREKFSQRTAILDVRIRFVRDFTPSVLNVFEVDFPQEDYLLAVVSPRHGLHACGPRESWTRPFPKIPLDGGDYLAGIPLDAQNAGGGLCILLDESPLVLSRYAPNRGVRAEVPDWMDNGVRSGDGIRYRFLLIGYSEGERPANLGYAAGVRRFLGFDGEPLYRLNVLRGSVASQRGVLRLIPQNGSVDFQYTNPGEKRRFRLPVAVEGMNGRWTAGIYFVGGTAALWPAASVAGELPFALDSDDATHVRAGHPVVADVEELFVQWVQLSESPPRFHVYVNNPMDRTVRATLQPSMEIPGFEFPATEVEVPAGGDWEWWSGEEQAGAGQAQRAAGKRMS